MVKERKYVKIYVAYTLLRAAEERLTMNSRVILLIDPVGVLRHGVH